MPPGKPKRLRNPTAMAPRLPGVSEAPTTATDRGASNGPTASNSTSCVRSGGMCTTYGGRQATVAMAYSIRPPPPFVRQRAGRLRVGVVRITLLEEGLDALL